MTILDHPFVLALMLSNIALTATLVTVYELVYRRSEKKKAWRIN